MCASLTQDTRIGSIQSPLGKDVLALVRLAATEGLGELFEYHVDAVSEQKGINFDQAIGQACNLSFKSFGGPDRHFDGILVEAQATGMKDFFYSYHLVLRPWLWLLTRTSDCRIFQDKTAPEIVKKVFSDRGFTDFQDSTTEDHPKIEYCVQYRENDFDFVSRLMEAHGIYYFFEHTASKHTMVLADAKSCHKAIPGHSSMRYIPIGDREQTTEEYVREWVSERRFRTGRVELNDYDFEQPNADLISDADGSAAYTRSHMERYDYPGKYTKRKDGEKYAKIQLEAEQAFDNRRQGLGDAISLFPGGLVTLKEHPTGAENQTYLVLSAQHRFEAEGYRSGGDGESGPFHEGTYRFLPASQVYRSPPTTPKPIIHGLQTAKVVGDSGEEIDVDKYGRIKVQFFWDRKKMQSCRVRVAQVWSGKSWGGQVIPRIDQEVIVEFLEGDPDKPLVTGTVYNADLQFPYPLPDNKTMSGLKSDTTKGHNGYNEFVFEDKKNSEKIRMHGEKDHEVVIRNAETWEIGDKFSGKDDVSRKTTLHNGSDKLTLENGNQSVKISGKQEVNVDETISITAIQKITLTVGASTIVMEPAKITVTSPTIELDSIAGTTINGGAAITLVAGLIQIN